VIHLDTSFLVDLLREGVRGRSGSATGLLEQLGQEDLWISVFVACELAAGAELAAHPRFERLNIERLCSSVQVAFPDERFPPAYGRLLAWQHRHEGRIATMDLLIATSAVVAGTPLVTRSERDFSRVPGLEVLSY
jgi:predicted nucleic acid-binding protein